MKDNEMRELEAQCRELIGRYDSLGEYALDDSAARRRELHGKAEELYEKGIAMADRSEEAASTLLPLLWELASLPMEIVDLKRIERCSIIADKYHLPLPEWLGA